MGESGAASGVVAEIWRYPVKSMGGERIERAELAHNGIAGDRSYAVVDVASGKIASAKLPRQWGALLQCRARSIGEPAVDNPVPVEITLPDGTVVRTEDPEIDATLSTFLGREVRLVTTVPDGAGYLAVWPDIEGIIPDEFLASTAVEADEAEGRVTDLAMALAAPGTFFDVAALHLVTTATLAGLAELAPESKFPVERFRPNLLLDLDVAPFAENDWTGAIAEIGTDVAASVLVPTMRCIMTTLAQGALERDPAVLRAIARHNRIELTGLGTWSCVGAYAAVSKGGEVGSGDPVRVAPVG